MNENTQQTTNSTPEETGGKLFTQQQVNEIVRERLARERAKAEPTAIDERETALKAREARLDCRDYLEELSKGGKAGSAVCEQKL